MVKITATREIRYAGKTYLPGQTFEATEKDAKIYVAIKRATAALPVASKPRATLKTLTAPTPALVPKEAAPEAPPHPSFYNRRDMTAVTPAGPTGPVSQSPSSPPAPPPEASTSPGSEEEEKS